MSNSIAAEQKAIQFLQSVRPDGPWLLSAINPDRKAIVTKRFDPKTVGDAESWLRVNMQRKWNLYWHVNPTCDELTDDKAKREDITRVELFHVDVDAGPHQDLRAERNRILGLFDDKLPKGVPQPTILISSGGGYQAFWKLETPIQINGDLARAEDAKRYNKQLERRFGADNCHNIDRLMRLPYTLNVPDAKKLAKGRVEAMADVVWFLPENVYPLSAFEKSAPETAQLIPDEQTPVPAPASVSSLDMLDQYGVDDRLKVIMVQGHHPDEPKAKDNSRSAWVFDFVCNMLRRGVPEEMVLGIIMDPGWKISDSVLDKKGSAQKYAAKQIIAAREAISEFATTEKGKVHSTPRNFRIALTKLGIAVSYDLFAERTLLRGLPGFDGELSDAAVLRARVMMEERFGWLPSKDFAHDMIMDTARYSGFHPVCDYLDALEWDRVGRLETWLIDLAGAPDTPFVRAVSKIMLIAAVRRVRQPGCKFDEMLVLESEQGWDKSSALQLLAGGPELFLDDMPLTSDSRDIIEQTQGKWIVECAELNGMGQSRIEHIKAMLSRQWDRARRAYGRLSEDMKRQWIAIGTTNDGKYLHDTTGNRRFWPVQQTKPFDTRGLRAVRDQLWAEASYREAQDESIRLSPTLYAAAAGEQGKRLQEDVHYEVIKAQIGDCEGRIREVHLWDLAGLPGGARKLAIMKLIRANMAKDGWKYNAKMRFGSGQHRLAGWERGDGAERLRQIAVRMEFNQPTLVFIEPTPAQVHGAGERSTCDEVVQLD